MVPVFRPGWVDGRVASCFKAVAVHSSTGRKMIDLVIINSPVYFYAGTKLPSSKVSLASDSLCGLNESGWMKGQHPVLGEPPQVRRVCWLDDCNYYEDITIVACGEPDNVFYLYQLNKPEHCKFNYCAV